MRDPTTRVDPKVEAAIEHAVKLLRPFVRKSTLRVRDPPWHRLRKALESVDDGRRRTLDEWEKRLGSVEVSHPRGHPSYGLRRAVILLVLDEITAFGFRRRRNQTNYNDPDKRASGCSIVTTALNRLGVEMSEARLVDLIRPLRRRRRAN
jgi:hypothetical protein